jgi:CBS domain-containing protein
MATMSASPSRPSPTLLGALREELQRHPPFGQMAPEQVDALLAAAREAYFAPGEVITGPGDGVAAWLYVVRQGSVSGRRGDAAEAAASEYGPGEMFPVAAVLGDRPSSTVFTAHEDCFCLAVPAATVRELASQSPPLAGYLGARVMQLLALAQAAAREGFSAQSLAEQSLEARLATLPARQPLACAPGTPLADALLRMHERRVGSVVVVDGDGRPGGILTRHDILGRVTLPQRPLSTPIAEVMSAPVQCLDVAATLQDAALLMARDGIRHVPVTEGGRLVNIVSERDLFALQRQSLKQLGTAIRAAASPADLPALARQIRAFARNLLGQGVQARQLTELISHLNDVLTARLVELVARQRGLDLDRACWLAFGSEGRGEQTIATDQDNGLAFDSPSPDADRPAWQAFGHEVNLRLADCGYPLCTGGVMAGAPEGCLTPAEWAARFSRWIAQGTPEHVLKACIYFDLRPLAGQAGLVRPLREGLLAEAARTPRFIRQLAGNLLERRVPLSWRGAVETSDDGDGGQWLDLKLQGTAIFVEAARLYALAFGLPALGTRERLAAAAPHCGVPADEAAAWIGGFEYLQSLRLRVQLEAAERGEGGEGGEGGAGGGGGAGHPNRIDLRSLSLIERRLLKESLRMARQLQQRIELDYLR